MVPPMLAVACSTSSISFNSRTVLKPKPGLASAFLNLISSFSEKKLKPKSILGLSSSLTLARSLIKFAARSLMRSIRIRAGRSEGTTLSKGSGSLSMVPLMPKSMPPSGIFTPDSSRTTRALPPSEPVSPLPMMVKPVCPASEPCPSEVDCASQESVPWVLVTPNCLPPRNGTISQTVILPSKGGSGNLKVLL